MPPFRSLRVSLNIALLSLSLAVLFVSGGSGVLFNFLNQQTVIANQQRSIAKDAANSVKGFIGERLGILSATTRVANLSIVQNAEQKLVMSRLLGLEPTFRQLVLLDVQGRELAAISRLSAVIPSQLKGQIGEELFSFCLLYTSPSPRD